MDLKILIPFLNDGLQLEELGAQLSQALQGLKYRIGVFICDGGSTQGHIRRAKGVCQSYGWTFVSVPEGGKGLADVLQNGVSLQVAQRIFILPADCRVDQGLLKELLRCPSKYAWGGFPRKYISNSVLYPLYLFLLNQIFARTGRLVWTNGIFAYQDLLERAHWSDGSFLVDWKLTRELRKNNRFFLGRSKITVSDHRYRKVSLLKQIARNAMVVGLHSAGVRNPKFLKRLYSA